MTQELSDEAHAVRLYGEDAGQCPICGRWGLEGWCFDGTYFTCDPDAKCNQPGYDYDTDMERL